MAKIRPSDDNQPMCNLYVPPTYEQLNKPNLRDLWLGYVAPLKPGPYMLANGEITVGQWGMIPKRSRTRRPSAPNGMPISTNNARRERLAIADTYKGPWLSGQRCLIPAVTFDEPYYPAGSKKSIAWRFSRADGELWALAGLYDQWIDPETGEVVPSYTMITQNCDVHPLLNLMHKPDPKFAPDKQDKRAVVPLETNEWDQWLHGTVEQAEELIQLPAIDIFCHGAADEAKNIPLPGIAHQTQRPVSSDRLFGV